MTFEYFTTVYCIRLWHKAFYVAFLRAQGDGWNLPVGDDTSDWWAHPEDSLQDDYGGLLSAGTSSKTCVDFLQTLWTL